MAEPILEIDRLGISFFTRAGEIPAVMDFSCKVMPGEAMGLVGESGCGKSTVALAVMRDLPGAGKITSGSIRFDGRDMASLTGQELRAIRGSRIAMVYQEPMASLNPTMLIGRQLMEVPLIHDKVSKEEARARALDMVKAVRLPDPERDHARLSASALRRPAAARRHRHGALVEPAPPDPRRADDRARRDGRSRHRRAGQGPDPALRGVVALHLAQSWSDPRDLRCRHGHVFRRGRRDGPREGRVRSGAPSLYAGPFPFDAAAGNEQERQSAGPDSGPAAAAARTAEGMQFRPPLPALRRGPLRSGRCADVRGGWPRRPSEPVPPDRSDRLVCVRRQGR